MFYLHYFPENEVMIVIQYLLLLRDSSFFYEESLSDGIVASLSSEFIVQRAMNNFGTDAAIWSKTSFGPTDHHHP
jgi:hypothetical protein